MLNPHRQAEIEIAARMDQRVQACRAVVRYLRDQRYPSPEMLRKADALEALADACTEVSDFLTLPTPGEFIALAKTRREIWRKD